MRLLRALRREHWIDISIPLQSGMVHWPGDPPVRITQTKSLEAGDHSTVSKLSMGSHTGTHMDAPLHFLRRGMSLDQMPFSAAIGPARVIAIDSRRVITPEELRRHHLRAGERVLLKTRNSPRCWTRRTFTTTFVHLSAAAARYLARARIQTIGIDYLSVGGYQADGAQAHRALLSAGIWIIEGLNLTRVTPGAYFLVCLPLRIAHSDGAPARAVVQPMRPARPPSTERARRRPR